MDGMGQRPGQRTQRLDRQVRHRMRPDEIATRLPEHGHGSAGQGVGDITTAIGQIAGISQEEIARVHLAAVVGHTSRRNAERGQAVEQVARRNHSLPFPESAAATWTGASGGTPRVRRAPPVICEKAGPATSPP